MADGALDDFYGDQEVDESADGKTRDREWTVLHRLHHTAGFREGSSAARDRQVQKGFDAGFLRGAQMTSDAGFW